MKKLIAMMGAVAMAFGLYADGLKNTVGFEDGAYTAGSTIDVTKDDAGITTEVPVWSATDPAETGTVTEYDDDAYDYGTQPRIVTDGPGAQYLALETQGLFRNITAGGAASALADGDVFFDTLVKLSATDGLAVPDVGDGKLAIWAGTDEDAESGVTNLIVTAAAGATGLVATPTNFTIDVGSDFDFNAWHRITVRSLVAGAGNSIDVAGFVVFVDGVQVACSDEDYADKLGGGLELGTEATKFAAQKQLFIGLAVGDDAAKVYALGFKGNGAADDIAITDATYAPDFAKGTKDFTLTWNPDQVTDVTINDVDAGTSGSFTLPLEGSVTTVTIAGTPVESFMITELTSDVGEVDGMVITGVTEPATAELKSAAIAYTIGSNNYADFASALEAAIDAGEPTTITVAATGAGWTDMAEIDNADADVTLDLNGKTLTFADYAVETVFYASAGKLTVIDSVGGGKIAVALADGYEAFAGVFYADEGGTITIGAAEGDEGITVDGPAIADLNGGKLYFGSFSKDDNDAATLTALLADGDNYKIVEEGEYLTVKKNDTPTTGTVIFICDKLGAPVTNEQEVGTTVALPTPTDPTQIRTFKGWFEEEALETPVTEPVTVVEGETKIWGKAVIEIDNNEIATALDLQKLQAAVAEGNTFAGETLTQTADIDMSALEWTGIGPIATATGAFAGTYDGAGNKIDNLTFKMGNQKIALFNSINGATIKNLVVDSNGFTGTPEDGKKTEGGAILVYRTHGTCVFENVTTEGTYSSNYNPAGFVSDSYGNVTFTSCTNKATIASTYTKAAGFIAIRNAGTVSFVGCVNEGAISADNKFVNESKPSDGYASGFVAYWTNETTGDYIDVNFKNCVNTGAITASSVDTGMTGLTSAFVTQCQSGKSVTDLGGNIAAETLPAVNNIDGTLTGFTYAVPAQESGYVTYVTELELNGSYKVMNKYAAPVFEFTEEGTIAFNTNMFFVADYTGITAPDLELTSAEKDGIVIFTAAAPAPAEWPDPAVIPEGQTVAEAIPALAEGPLANANAKSLVIWAKGVGSVNFADAANIKADAYLLNIANDGDVDAAKAAFKVTISFDEDGKPVIETLPEGHVYNELQLLGRQDLTTGTWDAMKDGDLFFKAELKIPTK